MIEKVTRRVVLSAAALAIAARSPLLRSAVRQPGRIRIGHSTAYSGPASAYGTIGRTEIAFFKMINAQGGINGHQVDFITYDDAYLPGKMLEQTRRLVEQDQVDLLFHQSGTANVRAIAQYVEDRRVPTLFVASGASKWNDPQTYPTLMGWAPSYSFEAELYARDALATVPNPRIALLYQNDDFGKDYLVGIQRVLRAAGSDALVAATAYSVTDATIEGAITSLKASGANVLIIAATTKFAAQAIRRTHELGWNIKRYLSCVSASIADVLRPAGLDAADGLVSANYLKEIEDPQWRDAPDIKAYHAFMRQWNPGADPLSGLNVLAFAASNSILAVLEACGDDFSRANIMRQAESLRGVAMPMLLPGVTLNTSARDHAPIESMRLMRFARGNWTLFGGLITAGGPQA